MIPKIKSIVSKNIIAFRLSFIIWQLLNDLYDLLVCQVPWAITKTMSYFVFLATGLPVITSAHHRIFKKLGELSKELGVEVIIDVGANDGWFYKLVKHYVGKEKKYIGFEPIKSEYEKLLKQLNAQDEIWNYCIGSETGKSIFYEYGTTGVSSTKRLVCAKPYGATYDTTTMKEYEVEIQKLDDVVIPDKKCLLKIDVQGAELEVLKGAAHLIESGLCKLVLVEVMVIPKYAGQPQWDEIINFMVARGFRLKDLHLASYSSNFLSEMDLLFAAEA